MGLVVTLVFASLVAFLVGRAAGWYGAGSDGPGIIASIFGPLA
jgi:hypothetical protein